MNIIHISRRRYVASDYKPFRLVSDIIQQVRQFFVICLITSLSSSANAEWVEWIADTDLRLINNDNINQSAFKADERDDTFAEASFNLGRYFQLNDLTRLRLTADIDGRKYDIYNELDSVSIGLSATLRHKFSVGPNAPWLRGNISVAYLDMDENVRDSRLLGLDLHAGKRLTPRLDAVLGYSYRYRNGRDSGVAGAPPIGTSVFDQINQQLAGGINFLVSNRLLLSANYTYLDGDFDSACTVANVGTVLANENVKALILDNVFDGCVYRLEGNIDILSVDLSFALNRHASLNLGYSFRDGHADVLEYESSIVRASFRYSY